MPTFLIVDVSNLAYRSAYAHQELRTSAGKFSGHVFGSVASLLSLVRNNVDPPVTMCFCYDGKRSRDSRVAISPEYKANRKPHDFNPIPEVVEILRLWPGIHIEQEDKEGDDAIAFAVKMRQGLPCVVYSGDKDLWALTAVPGCKVLSPNLKPAPRFVEPTDIYERYHLTGEHPERIYLAKALFGDSSDEIVGVERLIKKYVEPILNAENITTPEDFYSALGDTRPSFMTKNTWDKLQANVDRVKLNYRILVPQLDFNRESAVKVSPSNSLKLKLVEYECFSLLNQF
jgi:5'-3' exonuclease